MEYKTNSCIEKVSLDSDIYLFLKYLYFGKIDDVYIATSRRAYLDMNRTIRFLGLEDGKRQELRERVSLLLKEQIIALLDSNIKNQEEYDKWHMKLSDLIIFNYKQAGVIFSYGQSQKWINMTFKYLYIIGANNLDPIFKYLHIPLDNYVFEIAQKEFNIDKPAVAWSRWTDYDGQYLTYQKELRNKIKGYEPLRWEFKYWLKEARNVEGL